MASEAPSTLLHKIVFPVITTVLGATAIYFLGFNKKSAPSELEIEKATVSAWQSFVSTENIYYKTTMSLSKEYNEKIPNIVKEKGLKGSVPVFTAFKEDLFNEVNKLKEDIHEIIKKNEDIDIGFRSMLNRTLVNLEDEEKKTKAFFKSVITLIESDGDDAEKGKKMMTESEQFLDMEKNMQERAATEAEDIAQALSKKYNRTFDLNELLLYVDYKKELEAEKNGPGNNIKKTEDDGGLAPADPDKGQEVKDEIQNKDNTDNSNNFTSNSVEPTTSLLTGVWTMNGGSLELNGDGEMYWEFGSRGYTSGDWKLSDGKIRMNATNPDTKQTSLIIGYISDFTGKSFTLTFMSTPKEVYNFKKKNN